jgi:hypothetical protein
MADTNDLLLAAGAAGAVYWLTRRRSRRAPAEATAPKPPPALAPSPAPVASGPAQPISRAYDPLFAAHGQGLPVAYLRALAAHESDMHADAGPPGRGLFSVVDVVRADYNQRHGTRLAPADLLDPAVNTQVAADALRRIVDGYARSHRAVPNLREDWTNPRFVELVTFGWNAGFSERGGVGRVASYLERLGTTELTLDVVAAAAARAGASPHLSDPRKVRYCRDVTATYFRERERDEREGRAAGPVVVVGAHSPPEAAAVASAASTAAPEPAHTPSP